MFAQFLKTSLVKNQDFDLGVASNYFSEWSDQFWPVEFDVDWEISGRGIEESLKWLSQHGVTGFTLIMFSTDDIKMYMIDPFSGHVEVFQGSVVIDDESPIQTL